MDADELVGRLHVPEEKRAELRELADATTPRPVVLLLIGTSRSPDLERGIRFLEERGLSVTIRIVSFGLFRQPGGGVLMSREVEEKEQTDAVVRSPGSRTATIQGVRDLAEKHGVLEEVKLYHDIADHLALKVKAWPLSITINSPANWRKTLLYIGPKEGGAAFGYSPESLVEAFGATEAEVAAALGPNWAVVSKAELPGLLRRAEEFLRGLQVRVKAAENAAAEPTARAST